MQLKENDMFLEKPKVDMENAYGLHYPGEVLERIGEHLTLTKRTYRALGLALARMMPLFTGDLYVQWNSKESVLEKDETDSWRERPVFDQYQLLGNCETRGARS